MITYQRVRKTGNSYAVTVSREVMDEMGIHEGDLVAVEIRPAEVRPVLSAREQAILTDLLERYQPLLERLK